MESVLKKKRKATVGRMCKKGMKEWGVMDDECGEWMEPYGRSSTKRTEWVRFGEISVVDGEKPGVGKHTGRNDLVLECFNI